MTDQFLISQVQTPALLIDADVLERNLPEMAAALLGPRLRPHVKAHKCTNLARRQAAAGHNGFAAGRGARGERALEWLACPLRIDASTAL